MRLFRQLPPFLRVVGLLGLLLAMASLVLIVVVLISFSPFSASGASVTPPPMDSSRLLGIGINLGMLSGACSFIVNSYSARFRWTGRDLLPLTSWQAQARAILLLATLPFCAIALIVAFPSAFLALLLAFVCTMVAAMALIVVNVSVLAR